LQQVAKGNQGRTSIVLFCHGTKNWIIQENRGAWVHPARKDTNSELQRLSTQLLARIPKLIRVPTQDQWSYTSRGTIFEDFLRNAFSPLTQFSINSKIQSVQD
jgi:hypothetical protein